MRLINMKLLKSSILLAVILMSLIGCTKKPEPQIVSKEPKINIELQGEVNTDIESLVKKIYNILGIKLNNLNINLVVVNHQDDVKVKGFYVPETNTIYIDSYSVNKYVIGHELTHAILGQYFLMPVSEKIEEVLAGYVEYELKKS
jgi:Zn-dependent peptidase ImmA (M78 family)